MYAHPSFGLRRLAEHGLEAECGVPFRADVFTGPNRTTIIPIAHVLALHYIVSAHLVADELWFRLLSQRYLLFLPLLFQNLIVPPGIEHLIGAVPVVVFIRDEAAISATQETTIMLIFNLWCKLDLIILGMNLVSVFASDGSVVVHYTLNVIMY